MEASTGEENRENMPENETKAATKSGDEDAAMTNDNSTRRGLKILFLSSDTGGGHRASAESLAEQFQLLFPGSTYDLVDVVEKDGVPPYNSLVSTYKHLSAHPTQWKLIYNVSNSRAFELFADAHLKLMCERAVRKSIKAYNPDVVISVHPLMCNVPVLSCSKISKETGKKLPMFTVVTDLGSAHCLWFANGVDRMFVGSEQVKSLAMKRGKVPEEKIELAGLPIRHDFAIQSEKMGHRMSSEGKVYQRTVREELELPVTDRHTILVMGGGEGVGSLANIVDSLYVELVTQGIDVLILVICGRNEKLKKSLETRDWNAILERWQLAKERTGLSSRLLSIDVCGPKSALSSPGCIDEGSVTGQIRRIISHGSLSLRPYLINSSQPSEEENEDGEVQGEEEETNQSNEPAEEREIEVQAGSGIAETSSSAGKTDEKKVADSGDTVNRSSGDSDYTIRNTGKVDVVGLGFVERMAEYMVAADVLVSKAGPGTISEAAALSLPVLLTSFLPGQEEGNVEYVVQGGFGAYVNDSDPIGIAEEVCMWLLDQNKLRDLSNSAKVKGVPYAARNIAKAIGERTYDIIDENEKDDENKS